MALSQTAIERLRHVFGIGRENTDSAQELIDHVDSGYVKEMFVYQADPTLLPGHVGQMLMNDGSDTAKLYERTDKIAATAEATINNPGQLAAPEVRAFSTLLFNGQPDDGDEFKVRVRNNTNNYQRAFRFVAGASNAAADPAEIHIGTTVADTIAEALIVFDAAMGGNPAFPTASDGPGDSIVFTSSNLSLGASGNVAQGGNGNPFGNMFSFGRFTHAWGGSLTAPFVNDYADSNLNGVGSGNLELQDVVLFTDSFGGKYLGPDNGIDEMEPSVFHFADTYTGEIVTLIAGIDWTPTGSANAEAAAILAEAQAIIEAAGWSVELAGNVISMTSDVLGENPPTLNDSNNTGFMSAQTSNGSDGTSPHNPLGILVALLPNNKAVIGTQYGQEFKFDDSGLLSCSAGDILVGGKGGNVAKPNANGPSTTDWVIGIARNDATPGQRVTLDYIAKDATLFQSPQPLTLAEAIYRIGLVVKNNLGQP